MVTGAPVQYGCADLWSDKMRRNTAYIICGCCG